MTEDRKKMEDRRKQAIGMFTTGHSQADVARVMGVTRTSASRWWHAWRNGSDLSIRMTPGRPLKMDFAIIEDFVRQHPDVTIWELQRWISDTHGVWYHEDHLYRMRARIRERMKA